MVCIVKCRICGENLEYESAVSCCECDSPFHRDCWEYNGRCSIYGCGASKYRLRHQVFEYSPIRIDERTLVPDLHPEAMTSDHIDFLNDVGAYWGCSVYSSLGFCFATGLWMFVDPYLHLIAAAVVISLFVFIVGFTLGLIPGCLAGLLISRARHENSVYVSFVCLMLALMISLFITNSLCRSVFISFFTAFTVLCLLHNIEGFKGETSHLWVRFLVMSTLLIALNVFVASVLRCGARDMALAPLIGLLAFWLPYEFTNSKFEEEMKSKCDKSCCCIEQM